MIGRLCGRLAQAIHRLPGFPGQWRLAAFIGRAASGGSMILRDEHGLAYRVQIGNVVGHMLLTKGTVEPQILALTSKGGDVIIDVGCNVGTFALPASRHARRVIAIDADKAMCEAVIANCRLNRITNVTVIHTAISASQDARISFFRARAESSVSSLVESHVGQFDRYDEVVVPNARLEAIIDELGDVEVATLKIDAEGVTGAVIASLGRHAARVRSIIAEPSDDLADPECVAILEAFDVGQPLAAEASLPDHTRFTVVATRRA